MRAEEHRCDWLKGFSVHFRLLHKLLYQVLIMAAHENFRVEGKKLYFGFVDLDKAFDRVLREVI